MNALANQLRVAQHSAPSAADTRGRSAWFHQGYGIGRALYEAMTDTLTLCGAADPSFPQTVEDTRKGLEVLRQRMEAYDRAVGLAR
jgi:hypothetical protein